MKFLLPLALIFLIFACKPAQQVSPYTAKTYTVFMRGNSAGVHTSERDSAGNYLYSFTYNDRGRGPELTEKIRLDDEGNIASLEISGVNYLKDSISEVFSTEGSKTHWESSSESGEGERGGFYVSVNATLGDSELMLRRLLDSPDRKIDLLPSGNIELATLEEVQVMGKDLRLAGITGLDLTPSYLWLDQDNRIFASVSSWLSMIEAENGEMVEPLLEIQTEKEKAFLTQLAEDLTETHEGKIVLKNVNVFEAETATLLPNHSVVISGNRIEAVLSYEKALPKEAHVIDGAGKTLLPGLFDNHCHVQRIDGLLHLAAGVTSVRDMANSLELLDIREEFNQNKTIGPRIATLAGFIDQKGPFAGPGLTITSVEEGLKAIEDYKNYGYHQIKLYSSIDPAWVKPLAAKAHELGLRLSGHIPAHMLAEEAIRDGFDEIQHVNMLILNFLSDTIDTRTPLRFSAVADNAYKLDLQGAPFQAFVNQMKSAGTVLDPTVSIFEGMFTTKAGEANPQFEAILDRLPLQIQRGFYNGGLPIPEGKEAQYKASFEKMLEIVFELHTQGVTIIPGTDATAGFALHKELENYVRAGIPTGEVLKMATLTSAQITQTDAEVGSIKAGKLADMILVDGNPLANIKDIRRVVLTIKDGNLYTPKKLYNAIGIQHFE